MKPQVLYHGSPIFVHGMILPHTPVDVKDNNPENNLHAVYASDNRELAISRAIQKGNIADVTRGKVAEPTHVFLYHLSPQTFEQSTVEASQYFSFVPVMPLKVESIKVFDYVNLIEPNLWQHLVTPPKSLLDKLLWGFAASPF